MSSNQFPWEKPIKIKPIKISGFGLPNRKKGKSVSKAILKKMVWQRDKGTCGLCHVKIRAGEDWDLARNRAGKRGGGYTLKNCFVAHHSCNISQGTKTRSQVKRELGQKTAKRKKKSRRRRKQNVGSNYWFNPSTGKKERINFGFP